ncbi:MAG: glycosyltransferase family 4 protein [Isosphaeraceae bacterium]
MKAIALVDAPDHVCCRYRIRAFEPALRRSGCDLEYQSTGSGLLGRWLRLRRLPRVDTAILQRKLLPNWHLQTLRRRVDRLVFDFDDAVLYRDSYDARGPVDPRRASRFAATVRAADQVIAGNDFLADCALRAGARPDQVRVIPTCVDPTRYPCRAGERDPGDLALVWIGSSSTLQGIIHRRPLWERLARVIPRVRMRLICDQAADLGAMPVEFVRWSEDTEAIELARGGVGISWVPDDLWSRGKCGLKILQYQAASLPVVTNPVGVHPEMVVPGVTGALAETDDEWAEAVMELASRPEQRINMGRAARSAVERAYSVEAWEGAFVAAVRGSGPLPPPNFPRREGHSDAQGTHRPGIDMPRRGNAEQARTWSAERLASGGATG